MSSSKFRVLIGLHRMFVIVVFVTLLLVSDHFGECRADPAQPPFKPSAEALARVRHVPIAYTYKKEAGTLDEQSHASSAALARDAAIAANGRSGDLKKSGVYAIAVLLLAIAGIVVWRRARERT